jgi:hypothetical protein
MEVSVANFTRQGMFSVEPPKPRPEDEKKLRKAYQAAQDA